MDEGTVIKACRACLIESGELKSVFTLDPECGITIHIAEMIMAFTSVQITLGDGLPEQICSDCAEKAVSMYLFKLQCEKSDEILRQRSGKSPFNCGTDETIAEGYSHFDGDEPVNIVVKAEIQLNSDECHNDSSDNFINMPINAEDKRCGTEKYLELGKDVSKEMTFVCDTCQEQFDDENAFSSHMKMHTMKLLSCDVCSKTFAHEDLLFRHKMIHAMKLETPNGEKDLSDVIKNNTAQEDSDIKHKVPSQCFCGVNINSEEQMLAHITTHAHKDSDGSFICKICTKRFSKAAHLSRHMRTHAPVKPHVCDRCNKRFARAEQLVNHLNAHSGIKPHVCKICSKGFNQISNLKDHMRTHNGERPFLCSTCGKGFNQLGNLRQHTIRHSGIKAHLCSICGNGFASKGELGAHLRKHTGARPFVCSICNNGFTTSSSLTKHKRIHSGEKPYECEVCNMKFSRSGILARHRRTHTGEKPYVCKFCSKAFSQSNDLSSHLRIHTGEKPYICDACGQAFRQSSALKTHKKTHMDRNPMLDKAVITHSLITQGSFLNALQ